MAVAKEADERQRREADPEALLRAAGFAEFRPGQREAVEAALAGRDALVVMPTGGGKSLCYQLPGLARAELTVVVSPLIALMADQVAALRARGEPAVMLTSAMPAEEVRAATARVRSGEARMLYCAPERFASADFLELLSGREVDRFVVDEAHCISEWGHDFRPDYLRLPRVIERLGRPAVMACTATATPAVASEISARLGLEDPLEVRSGFDRPNISFDVVALEGEGTKARKLATLRAGLRAEGATPAIVYCGTRKDTDEVAGWLAEQGIAAVPYHAGMDAPERTAAQERFMSGAVDVVVATNAFGMGVDKADVRSVWHWALPTSVEAYYQEAGRAGRDGLPARAVLLAARADLGRLVHFIQRKQVDPEQVGAFLRRVFAGVEGDAVTIRNPEADEDRIRLAIAERAGACAVEPAAGGQLTVRRTGGLSRGRAEAACRVARDRGWRAYRAIEAYGFGERCRRRALLEHFGDRSGGAPAGRCCDVCDPRGRVEVAEPDPGMRRRRSAAPSADDEPPLGPADEQLMEALREWRLGAAEGKPAYTVAQDRTLRAIARERPRSAGALEEIRGVGPRFIERWADEVLELVRAA